jgi:two-component system sensor histidine kinase DegS
MAMLRREAALPSAADAVPVGEVEALRRRLLRLALDVHDGPMQSLTAVGWRLQELRRDLEQLDGDGGTAATARLDLVGAELASVEAGLRSLITTLERNGSAEIDTLDAIAAAEIGRFNDRCDAEVELIVSANVRPDSHSQALAIAAVLREALTNIAKHAHANQVLIRLLASDFGILLEISDNGNGFNPDTTNPGIGLTSMHQRLRLLAGTLEITSTPGGPTRISAHLHRWQPPQPLPNQASNPTRRRSLTASVAPTRPPVA